jgi:hypothetical protein
MKRTIDFLKGSLGLLAILVIAAGLAALLTSLGSETQPQTFTSPPPPTEDPRSKIRDDLLRLIELEERQPGEAQKQTGQDYVFDKEGRIGIYSHL